MACGFVVELFWGYFWSRAGLLSPSLRLRTTTLLWHSALWTAGLNGEDIWVQLCPWPLPSASSCRRKGIFPVTFSLWRKHLFPTSCYCLPLQEVHHKCQENPQCGSDDEEVGVKNLAGERETIQFRPESQAEKKRQSQHLQVCLWKSCS